MLNVVQVHAWFWREFVKRLMILIFCLTMLRQGVVLCGEILGVFQISGHYLSVEQIC